MAVNNADYVHQFSVDASQIIGTEAIDPSAFSCNFGQSCRYSDSAWVSPNSGNDVTHGAIAQTLFSTTSWGVNGSGYVSSSHPRFYVAQSSGPIVGMQVEKVGQTTGWTTGTIMQNCVDKSNGIGFLLLCNFRTNYWADHGDSGSPVFFWRWQLGVDAVELLGIDWGGTDDVPPPNNREDVSIWSNVNYEIGPLDIVYKPRWQLVTNIGATDVGVGSNGAVWVISNTAVGADYTIFKLANATPGGETWQQVAGLARRIAVDPNGNPWVINSSTYIYRWNGSAFVQQPGLAIDIGIGADGTVWVIGTDNATYRWNGSGWTPIAGTGTRIAVDPSGNAWVVRGWDNTIWRYVNGVFQQVTGATATDIGIGGDGMVWIIGTNAGYNYDIKWWTGVDWKQVPGAAVAIGVARGGTPWVANVSQQLYRSF